MELLRGNILSLYCIYFCNNLIIEFWVIYLEELLFCVDFYSEV